MPASPLRARLLAQALSERQQQRFAYERATGRDRAVTVEPEQVFETVERVAGEIGARPRKGRGWPGWVYEAGHEVLAAELAQAGPSQVEE